MRARDHVVEFEFRPLPAARDRDVFVPLPAWPSWPWRRFMVLHALAIVSGLLLALGIYSLVRWDGHQFDSAGGGSESINVVAGHTFTFDEPLWNNGGSVTIENVALGKATRGLQLVGARIADLTIPHSVHGVGVSQRLLTLRLRVRRPGRYTMLGVKIWYRTPPKKVFGVPVVGNGHYVQITGESLGVCARAAGQPLRGSCPAP